MPHMNYLGDTEHGEVIAECEHTNLKKNKNISLGLHMCNHSHSSSSSSEDSLSVKMGKLSFLQGPQYFSQLEVKFLMGQFSGP